MGHGNYLISDESLGTVPNKKTYAGRNNPPYVYEISFNSYCKEMYAFRGYPGKVQTTTTEPVKVDNLTVRKNEEKNGIEIVFPDKPEQSILDSLKSHGFRWSRYSKLWWTRYTPEKWQFANSL